MDAIITAVLSSHTVIVRARVAWLIALQKRDQLILLVLVHQVIDFGWIKIGRVRHCFKCSDLEADLAPVILGISQIDLDGHILVFIQSIADRQSLAESE